MEEGLRFWMESNVGGDYSDLDEMVRSQKSYFRVPVPPPNKLIKQSSAPSRLPSIDSPPRQRVIHSPPINLRQSHYSVIPPLSRSSTTSPEDVDSESQKVDDIPLFPEIGEPHPFPYYITADVDLRPIRQPSSYLVPVPKTILEVDEIYPYDILEEILKEVVEDEIPEEVAYEVWNEEWHYQMEVEDDYVDDVYPYDVLETILEESVENELTEEVAMEVLSEERKEKTVTLYNKFANMEDGRIRIRCPIHGPRFS